MTATRFFNLPSMCILMRCFGWKTKRRKQCASNIFPSMKLFKEKEPFPALAFLRFALCQKAFPALPCLENGHSAWNGSAARPGMILETKKTPTPGFPART
ncbi:MAG: hypothetical protein R3D90_14390 [Paracoccaceae bacterium]